MAVVTKRNQSEMPKHQYRLNDNHKGADFASINGVNLSRDYKTFFAFQHDIKDFVKTYNNPDGKIDYRVLNPIENDNMLDSSEMNYGQKREIHTRKTLSTFSRKEIEAISLDWLINPVKKRTEFLIDLIMKEQTLYEEYMAKHEENINTEDDEDEDSFNVFKDSVSDVIDAKNKLYEKTGQVTSGQITDVKEEK